jgi:hypothetical protein
LVIRYPIDYQLRRNVRSKPKSANPERCCEVREKKPEEIHAARSEDSGFEGTVGISSRRVRGRLVPRAKSTELERMYRLLLPVGGGSYLVSSKKSNGRSVVYQTRKGI